MHDQTPYTIDGGGNYNFNNKFIYIARENNANDTLVNNQSVNNKLNNYLKKDGSIELTSNWDIGNNREILASKTPSTYNALTNKSYVDTRLNTKANTSTLSNYLKKDGSNKLTANLDL